MFLNSIIIQEGATWLGFVRRRKGYSLYRHIFIRDFDIFVTTVTTICAHLCKEMRGVLVFHSFLHKR